MTEPTHFENEGTCAICGHPTAGWVSPKTQAARRAKGVNEEPFVCKKCLVDLRGDMATELQGRRRLTNVEGQIHSVNTELWVTGLALTLAVALLGFLAGQFIRIL